VSALDPALAAAIERVLGERPREAKTVGGGDINLAFDVTLERGRRVFVKTHPRAPMGMYQAEAKGLAWLAEANAMRVPEVLGVSAADDEVQLLALEHVEPGRWRVEDFDERVGRGVASLHLRGAPTFGLDYDNWIGSLAQSNTPHATWVELYHAERLEPQLRLASERGRATATMSQGFERLFAQLESLVGPEEPPARLHGDLWSGNLHVDERGEPVLIDPAVYGGHREVDLAMMQLFGGFSGRVFDAYEEAYPLDPDYRERVGLYQLYPLLVHVNLFGGSYIESVERTLGRIV
jgi:fructosamine-3-kinase